MTEAARTTHVQWIPTSETTTRVIIRPSWNRYAWRAIGLALLLLATGWLLSFPLGTGFPLLAALGVGFYLLWNAFVPREFLLSPGWIESRARWGQKGPAFPRPDRIETFSFYPESWLVRVITDEGMRELSMNLPEQEAEWLAESLRSWFGLASPEPSLPAETDAPLPPGVLAVESRHETLFYRLDYGRAAPALSWVLAGGFLLALAAVVAREYSTGISLDRLRPYFGPWDDLFLMGILLAGVPLSAYCLLRVLYGMPLLRARVREGNLLRVLFPASPSAQAFTLCLTCVALTFAAAYVLAAVRIVEELLTAGPADPLNTWTRVGILAAPALVIVALLLLLPGISSTLLSVKGPVLLVKSGWSRARRLALSEVISLRVQDQAALPGWNPGSQILVRTSGGTLTLFLAGVEPVIAARAAAVLDERVQDYRRNCVLIPAPALRQTRGIIR